MSDIGNDFPTPIEMSTRDHGRVSEYGKACGELLCQISDKGIIKLIEAGEPDERCKTCAFRRGTVPNGCIQTMGDATKAAFEGVPFLCHQDQKRNTSCYGWYAARVALHGAVIPTPWEFTEPYGKG